MTILASVNNKTVMPGITPIADVPDAPTIGTATAAGLAASITFTAATTGGTPTTFTATSTPGSLTGTASSSPVTVSGLTEGTSYTFTVTAGNSTGTSPASAASNSITAVSPLTGGYDALATVIVPSGGLSSIVFASIPAGYKHLQVRAIGRSVTADTSAGYDMTCFFNGDSTLANYYNHYLFGNGSSAGAGANANNAIFGGVVGNGSPSNTFSGMIMDFLDYSSTSKTKVGRLLEAFETNSGATNLVIMQSTLWNNTSAINSLTFNVRSGTGFGQYTQFALYGVK